MNDAMETVTVRKGSRAWAMAMYDAGKRVEIEYPKSFNVGTYWRVQNPHSSPEERGEERSTTNPPPVRDLWRLYVEPPQPITVQPGTSPWAMAQLLEGKSVGSRSENCSLHPDEINSFGPAELAATDWEVVPDR